MTEPLVDVQTCTVVTVDASAAPLVQVALTGVAEVAVYTVFAVGLVATVGYVVAQWLLGRTGRAVARGEAEDE